MASTRILIELSSKRLILKQNNSLLGIYPVAIGKPATPTPIGNFQVLNKITNPGGALGTRWIQFTYREHGIHGTNQPWLIGQAVSGGCVRMHNYNVEQVYSRVSLGTPVVIRQTLDIQPLETDSRVYTVNRGDSLWKISRQFNTTIQELRRLNNLHTDLIYPGQKLYIIPRQNKRPGL